MAWRQGVRVLHLDAGHDEYTAFAVGREAAHRRHPAGDLGRAPFSDMQKIFVSLIRLGHDAAAHIAAAT
jgi:hypothetical protein